MKPIDILKRPLLTEKVSNQMEGLRAYTFEVDRRANKLEIKKAVEEFYGVTVVSVNTMVIPAKARQRFTKSGILSGRKPAKKKAVVRVAEGEEINLYDEI